MTTRGADVRYVIYGAGAIGATIGARLFEAGRDVELIARGPHYEALANNGLRYGDPDSTRVLRIAVSDHPAKVAWREDDVVVLAMKGDATEDAVRQLAAVAPPTVAVVCAQNGVENERVALRRFASVYGMVVMMPATHLEPGAVDADSLPVVGVLDVGRYPRGIDQVIEHVAGDLTASGFRSAADPDVMRWKYEKLLLNLSTSVRAMCGPESGDDDDDRQIRQMLDEQLRQEALACYSAVGVARPSPQERADRWDGATTPLPIPGRPRSAGSGWQSLSRGTGTIESDYINGEIVTLGRLCGVPTPVNETVQRRSNDHARERRPPGALSIQDLARAAGAATVNAGGGASTP